MSCLKLMHTVKSLANIFNKINVNSAVQGIIKIQPTSSGKRARTSSVEGLPYSDNGVLKWGPKL